MQVPLYIPENKLHTLPVRKSSVYIYECAKLSNKSAEFQSLAADLDLIAVTETWLEPHILDCEILLGLDFSIHRRDRKDKTGGGVSARSKELYTNSSS
jgi:hypothetical protein